ncbi:MAG: alpha/beta hydrolase-fold protein [Gammaproteobacteria bacterium]|jgi:phospholipase/carboxylesterase
MDPNTPPVVIDTGPAPDASVIWLHGLGADGHDFEPVIPELGLPAGLHVRFVFPHAPVRPVTINGGMAMRAWFDYRSLDFGSGEAVEQILESTEQVKTLIEVERDRGIPPARILLAGFSQGGVVALAAALRWPERIGGVVALSCYLPRNPELLAHMRAEGAAPPVFQAHGREDPLIPVQIGEDTARWLEERTKSIQFKTYPVAHGVCLEELRDIGAWLAARFGDEHAAGIQTSVGYD